MVLTQEQQAILNGERGETLAKVMKTLIRYGEVFGADKMVPVTGKHNHLVALLLPFSCGNGILAVNFYIWARYAPKEIPDRV